MRLRPAIPVAFQLQLEAERSVEYLGFMNAALQNFQTIEAQGESQTTEQF